MNNIDQVMQEMTENTLIPKKDYGDLMQKYIDFHCEAFKHIKFNSKQSLEQYDNRKHDYSITHLREHIKEKYNNE